MSIKVICVYNNLELFSKVITNNENLGDSDIIGFDNTVENIPITKRYNHFIDSNVLNNDSDFWCLFMHQDFGLMENVNEVFEKLDPKFIYGAIGAFFCSGIFINKSGFKFSHMVVRGKILQGNDDFNFHEYGNAVKAPKIVNVVDCCFIVVHSSLIKKYELRFDENLSFHMYAEEFCYSAKKNHKIKTKVVPLNCFHMGVGVLNDEFKKSAQYLKDKFKIKRVPSTCYN